MKTLHSLLVGACLLLASCGLSPSIVSRAAARASDEDLLDAHGNIMRIGGPARDVQMPIFAAEIKKRGLVRENRTEAISRGQVEIGMNRNEVRAAWGKPSNIDKTTTISGAKETWRYGGFAPERITFYKPLKWAYFANGLTTEIEE